MKRRIAPTKIEVKKVETEPKRKAPPKKESLIKAYTGPTMADWWRKLPSDVFILILEKTDQSNIFSRICAVTKDICFLMDEIYWKNKLLTLYPQYTLKGNGNDCFRKLYGELKKLNYEIVHDIDDIILVKESDSYGDCPICQPTVQESLRVTPNCQIKCSNCQLILGERKERGPCAECNITGILLHKCCDCKRLICNDEMCYTVCEQCDNIGCTTCNSRKSKYEEYYCPVCYEELSSHDTETPEDMS